MVNRNKNRFSWIFVSLMPLIYSGACTAEQAIISEVKLGVLAHDVHVFSSSRKEDGIDFNGEILFNLPSNQFFSAVGSPRFHLGGSVNSLGDTNLGYLGLTWNFNSDVGVFVEGSFGGAIHDGKLDAYRLDRKSLGSRVLFRLSGSLGYQFNKHHSLAVMLDHVSNAGLANSNEGMDNVGIRYGFRF
jgi:lipid A 3-O-deacylase